MNSNKVVVIGGSGFLGRHVVRELVKAGYSVIIASRTPERALHTKTSAPIGKISFTACNIRNAESVKNAVQGAYAVINLVGILYEKRRQKFSAIHAKGAETVAEEARKAGVKRLVHISALGIEEAKKSRYARTKVKGEKAVIAAFPKATIIRPGILFGPEDNFFNLFAKLASFSPFLPLIGGGKAKFQPVYAGDVAKAIVKTLKNQKARAKIFELGGPKTYSFRELMEYILNKTGKKRLLIPIPFSLAKFMAFFAEFLPRPPLTADQVNLLRYDNVVSKNHSSFKSLRMEPSSVEEIVPDYLKRFTNE